MISVKVIRGDGDSEGPSIEEEMIPNDFIARVRGEAYLDTVYWNRRKRSFSAPHEDIEDGDVIQVQDPDVAEGQFIAQRVTIKLDGTKIDLEIDCEGEHEHP